MLIGDSAKIGNLVGGGFNLAGITRKALIRGSDQREIALERQREYHTAVSRLHDIAAVMFEQARDQDVAAFVEPCGDGGALA